MAGLAPSQHELHRSLGRRAGSGSGGERRDHRNLAPRPDRVAAVPAIAAPRASSKAASSSRGCRRRKTTAHQLEEEGNTRAALRRVEANEPGVMMGTCVQVLSTVGLAQDPTLVAPDDHGRHLQDGEPAHSTAPKTARALRIRLADYPMLREVAWSTACGGDLPQCEAFALYERSWRHIDYQAMNRRERHLVDLLTKTVGNGVLLA